MSWDRYAELIAKRDQPICLWKDATGRVNCDMIPHLGHRYCSYHEWLHRTHRMEDEIEARADRDDEVRGKILT